MRQEVERDRKCVDKRREGVFVVFFFKKGEERDCWVSMEPLLFGALKGIGSFHVKKEKKGGQRRKRREYSNRYVYQRAIPAERTRAIIRGLHNQHYLPLFLLPLSLLLPSHSTMIHILKITCHSPALLNSLSCTDTSPPPLSLPCFFHSQSHRHDVT